MRLHLLTVPTPLAGLVPTAVAPVLGNAVVFAADLQGPAARAAQDAGLAVRPVDDSDPAAVVDVVTAAGGGVLLDADRLAADVLDAVRVEAERRGVEVVAHPVTVAGGRLLDVVETMDRLRSPGGCPWDAEQTHTSLAPYLLEEAYEAHEALEDGDLAALREELGDVLLQVVFHARLAEEHPGPARWTIDDVADGLVRKLVRRHPHVFASTVVSGADEVSANWDAIKAAEKNRTSVTEGVTMGQPALTLAATLQRKAAGAGVLADVAAEELDAAETLAQAVCAQAARFDGAPSPDHLGSLLFAVVALARQHDLDPEAALRSRARRFRDRVAALERDRRDGGSTSVR